MTTLYGIKNCDTMKKARLWLDDHGVEYEFHDFKKAGAELKLLKAWDKKVGWEVLLNKRGTTYRKLDDKAKAGIDRTTALQLMIEQPSMIKRPVLVLTDEILIGFDAEVYKQKVSYESE